LVAPLSADYLAEDALKELKADSHNLPKTATTLKIRPQSCELNEQGLAKFTQASCNDSRSDLEYGSWLTLSPTEKQLWQADVRSADFKETERNARRLGALLLRITGWAAIFALVLIGAELLLLGCQTWLNTVNQQLSSQRNAVLTIQDKQALMNKLDQVAQNELRPIEIFTAANNDVRKQINYGIEYDSAIVEGDNIITIEGKAASINALNRYADSLKKSEQFELISGPEFITRSGNTTFTVTLAYTHMEAPQPEPLPEEAAEVTSPTKEDVEI
jgi:hypothetical protein